jgi:uncharacterized protein (TIRG00374 family)
VSRARPVRPYQAVGERAEKQSGGFKPSVTLLSGMLPDVDPRKTALGFGVALVILAVLVSFAGLDEVLQTLAIADQRVFPALVVVAACWLTAWALALRTVLETLGETMRLRTAVLLYAAAVFANNVTPFGQAGGEPFAGLLISRAADTEYENGLAAIASVDALNFVPSLAMATIGMAYFALRLTFGRRLKIAAGAIAAVSIAMVALVAVLYHYRRPIERRLARVIEPVVALAARFMPGKSPPSREHIHDRVVAFFDAIDRVAEDRAALAVTLSFTTLGWLALSASLWLSLFAVGQTVPFAAVVLAVPVGSLASATPLPGGLAGIETVIVAMLVPTTGVGVATATAAVFLHRIATYWLPTAVGGGAATLFDGS